MPTCPRSSRRGPRAPACCRCAWCWAWRGFAACATAAGSGATSPGRRAWTRLPCTSSSGAASRCAWSTARLAGVGRAGGARWCCCPRPAHAHAGRPDRGAARARTRAHPPPRLPRQPAAERGRGPAVLPPGHLVAVAPHPHRARTDRRPTRHGLACAPRRLALALSELSDLQTRRAWPRLHILQAADGSQLMSRIQRLLHPARRAHAGARLLFPLLGLVAAGIATYAWAQVRTANRVLPRTGRSTWTTRSTATASPSSAAPATRCICGARSTTSTRSSPPASCSRRLSVVPPRQPGLHRHRSGAARARPGGHARDR